MEEEALVCMTTVMLFSIQSKETWKKFLLICTFGEVCNGPLCFLPSFLPSLLLLCESRVECTIALTAMENLLSSSGCAWYKL